ncbi:butyrophilin-like protein 2 [Electrophorus electricus]|uniref:butyrophilin-like protein 2 n=1 Tax=Electrophorus electricus TaxID=8005 RepID=UPI0015D01F8A|nr:butyrophilin-like protein 2 [Electrophorus electricus]
MKCVWVILFLHWSLSGAQRFKLEGPAVPVVAAPGSDIVLPCSIKPKAPEQSHVSAVDMEVKWSRQDLGGILVHHYMNKEDKNNDQDRSYRGRTALFKEKLQYGDTSLLLKNVKVSDGGQYTCRVDSAQWKDHVGVLLKIEAVGRTPEITVLGTASGGVLLQCDSKGWWPVPELQWLDSEGAEVPAGVTVFHEDDKGFNVRRSLTANSNSTNTYICRVKQGQHVMEEKIDITGIGTSPVVSVVGTDASGGIQLVCETGGWTSEPELQWLDSEEAELPAGCTQSHHDSEGFAGSHRITVCSSDTVFYCRVKQHPRMKSHINIVGIGTSPKIIIEGTDGSGGLRLLCEIKGWRSEPELQWFSGGAQLPAGDKESHRDDEVYTVRRHVTAQGSGTFVCRVKQYPKMEAEITVAAQG